MKRPVPIDGSRATDALVKRFISSLESVSDLGAYIDSGNGAEAANSQLAEDAASRSNILYFDRFVDMFHEDIEGDIADYRSQIRCRTDKYDLISYCHEEERRILNEDRIAVSNEAIRDYSDRTLELTMATNREARFSKWIAIASMVFAGVSALAAMGLDEALYSESRRYSGHSGSYSVGNGVGQADRAHPVRLHVI